MHIGDTIRIGYYSQNGFPFTAEQKQMTLLAFVIDILTESKLQQMKELDQHGSIFNRQEEDLLLATTSSSSSVNLQQVDSEARKYLQHFQFALSKHFDKIETLSGGEQKRLQLLHVLLQNPNLLILDEPTNDLDLKTMMALEEFVLQQFAGCLLLVSHDQYFLNQLAQHLFVFEGQGIIQQFPSSYFDYLDYRRNQ